MKIVKSDEVSGIQSTCGILKELISGKIGIATVEMIEGLTVSHYHKKTTEYYYVLSGEGILAVKHVANNEARINLSPGMIIQIDPYDIHQTKSENGFAVLTVTDPAWSAEDEIETDDIFE